jgi:hypothetical protein
LSDDLSRAKQKQKQKQNNGGKQVKSRDAERFQSKPNHNNGLHQGNIKRAVGTVFTFKLYCMNK